MFLGKKYILGSELVEKMGINIANISILSKQMSEIDDVSTTVKLGNCTFIKKNSYNLPKYIKEGIQQNELTAMHNKVPCSHMRTEYNLNEQEIQSSDICVGMVNIAGKELCEFTDDFVNKVQGKIVYKLNKKETEECYANGSIEGYERITDNKYLAWYSLTD